MLEWLLTTPNTHGIGVPGATVARAAVGEITLEVGTDAASVFGRAVLLCPGLFVPFAAA